MSGDVSVVRVGMTNVPNSTFDSEDGRRKFAQSFQRRDGTPDLELSVYCVAKTDCVDVHVKHILCASKPPPQTAGYYLDLTLVVELLKIDLRQDDGQLRCFAMLVAPHHELCLNDDKWQNLLNLAWENRDTVAAFVAKKTVIDYIAAHASEAEWANFLATPDGKRWAPKVA